MPTHFSLKWKEIESKFKELNTSGINRDTLIKEIDNYLHNNSNVLDICKELGLCSAGFLFNDIHANSFIFFHFFPNEADDIPTDPYSLPYVWQDNTKQIKYGNLIHSLFGIVREWQKAKNDMIFRSEDFYRWIPPVDIPLRKSQFTEFDLHYCDRSEMFFFMYLYRLACFHIATKRDLLQTIDLRTKLDKPEDSFLWSDSVSENLKNTSIGDAWQNAILELYPAGENHDWLHELKIIGLIDSENNYDTTWMEFIESNCGTIQAKKLKFNELEIEIQKRVITILNKVYGYSGDLNAKNIFKFIIQVAPFPILPFYFWNALDSCPKHYLVSPVWTTNKVFKRFVGSTQETGSTDVAGFALCAVNELKITDLDRIQKIKALLSFISRPLVDLNFYMPLYQGSLNAIFQAQMHEEGHRTFRALYLLGEKEYNRLKKCKIPPLSFHDLNDERNLNENVQFMDELLRVIPKTDLHVHLGSCMSVNFLVQSSLISLASKEWDNKFVEYIKIFNIFMSNAYIKLELDSEFNASDDDKEIVFDSRQNEFWVDILGEKVKTWLVKIIDQETNTEKSIRSMLYKDFQISDHISAGELKGKISSLHYLDMAHFILQKLHIVKIYTSPTHPSPEDEIELPQIDRANFIRLLILVLASRYTNSYLKFNDVDLLNIFRNHEINDKMIHTWNHITHLFYDKLTNDIQHPMGYIKEFGPISTFEFKKNGWMLTEEMERLAKFDINVRKTDPTKLFYKEPKFESNSYIEYILSTGLRSNNLNEYLKGCEYSGAEHLRHPYLIHIFSREVQYFFEEQGIVYVELRCSPDGYVNSGIGFEYIDVYNCMTTAFTQTSIQFMELKRDRKIVFEGTQLPILDCKINLVFVGKRHKPIREMIIEAAAVTTTYSRTNSKSSRETGISTKTEVVGFDLAGRESDNPPEKYVDEFERLSKLHIPFTVHAGENAKSAFVESAILSLGARRIGHGLSLADDEWLMDRVREESVCIEMCPIGNQQTSHFVSTQNRFGRKYPMRKYFNQGIMITIGTDNPIISYTNIIREYFQASKLFDNEGLSLWDALKIIRMGFVSSFLTFEERRELLNRAESYLYEIFRSPYFAKGIYKLTKE